MSSHKDIATARVVPLSPDEEPTSAFFLVRGWPDLKADPGKCTLVGVMGETMEPSLPDGCTVLVDWSRRRRHKGGMFVIQTSDGMVVKHTGKDKEGNWLLANDNDKKYPSMPWPQGARVLGQVIWVGSMMRDRERAMRNAQEMI